MVLLIAAVAHYAPKLVYERSLRLYSDAPFYAQAIVLALLAFAIEYVAVTGAAPFVYQKF